MASKKEYLEKAHALQEQSKILKEENILLPSGQSQRTVDMFAQKMRAFQEELTQDVPEQAGQCLERFAQCETVLDALSTSALSEKERKKHRKDMEKLWKKISQDLADSLPDDKKKLVFFPYLYAMWDSLESVWKAAVDSGEFDVSVVPIPYYTRNADGSLGEIHYEGGEYPESVHIIHWESYSVAEHKPDIAYVHNPYDDMNRVTSIHPHFYSERLKPHVGSLVYIPYFVVTHGRVPDHFCVTPVTLRADKIIVQEEITRDIYISNLMQYGQDNGLHWSQKYLEQKVLALGSPKYDKEKTQDEILEMIPPQWHSIIFRPDGTKKKVIFFNTSINTLLQFGSLSLDRLEDALMSFYLQQQDIAMLWRPHPLISATYQSMTPQLYQRYLSIKETYLQGNWGILDESKDFNRAVCISDGYYGDNSSVVSIFREAKKPVMISNCKINLKG